MKQKLSQIKQNLPVVQSGSATDVQDFFNKIIKPQFKNKAAVKATHQALIDYVNREDAVFALRLYGTVTKKRYELLRRGFLTIYPDGKKMVFCDNTFAMPFAAMKLAEESYTSIELLNYMNDSNLRCAFKTTEEERELAYYKLIGNKASINLNEYGWYLAHIIPVGKYFNGKSIMKEFPNPDRSEWEQSSDKIRRPNDSLSLDQLAMLKAHFLRMIHPLNSFVVPKTTLVSYNGKNIGEESELIELVQNYIQHEFPEEYEQLKLIMQMPSFKATSHGIIGEITWRDYNSKITKVKPNKLTKSKMETKSKKEKDILLERLRGTGMSTFLKLYPLIMKNPDISTAEVAALLPDYAEGKSVKAQSTCLSKTRAIINDRQARRALELIMNGRVSMNDRELAEKFLVELK